MATLADRVLDQLRQAPAGLDDGQLAEALGATRQSVSQACRRLATQGKLERARGDRGTLLNLLVTGAAATAAEPAAEAAATVAPPAGSEAVATAAPDEPVEAPADVEVPAAVGEVAEPAVPVEGTTTTGAEFAEAPEPPVEEPPAAEQPVADNPLASATAAGDVTEPVPPAAGPSAPGEEPPTPAPSDQLPPDTATDEPTEAAADGSTDAAGAPHTPGQRSDESTAPPDGRPGSAGRKAVRRWWWRRLRGRHRG